MVQASKLSTVVNGEPNPNLPFVNWRMISQALTKTATKYTYSAYKFKYHLGNIIEHKPSNLSARDFDFKLPSNAYIKGIRFDVRMKATDKLDVELPYAMLCTYGKAYSEKYTYGNGYSTGFYDGVYLVNSHDNISTNWTTYSFTMNETAVKKAGINAKNINDSLMGIELVFKDAKPTERDISKKNFNKEVEIRVGYIECTVIYDIPRYYFTHTDIASADSIIQTGKILETTITFYQPTVANGKYQFFKLERNWGTEILSATSSTSIYDPTTGIWKVSANGKSQHKLKVRFKSHVGGYNELKLVKQYDELPDAQKESTTKEKVAPYTIGFTVVRQKGDYDEVDFTHINEPHKNHYTRIAIDITGTSNDGALALSLTHDLQTEFGKLSIDPNMTDDSVECLDDLEDLDDFILTFSVPVNTPYHIGLLYEFYPLENGDETLNLQSSDTGTHKHSFKVKQPYIYHISNTQSDKENYATLNPSHLYIRNHKIETNLNSETSFIECVADNGDTLMYERGCEMNMYQWEEQDFIGCIPLEQTHFDPKSTFKDKLLDTNYKNKRYVGKELAPDEDISLNIRVHPQDVTTLQSLIKMDKPIPINTNHKSFEGDSLNHRGWVEIYSIKAEKTNPNWYKCDIDVKYLTHHLLSRFKINVGSKTNRKIIRSIMAETMASGDPLDTEFFDIETDGTYMYIDDENIPSNQRNQFSLANGQSIKIRSRQRLPSVCELNCEWSSELIEQLEENNVSRIFRLIDGTTKDVVFEYEYDDYEFFVEEDADENENPMYFLEAVTCNCISRVLDNGGYKSTENEIDLRTEFGSGSLYQNDSILGNLDLPSEPCYGSTLRFSLDENILTLVDDGFSSREFSIENEELEGQSYYWEMEWKNNNDAENSDDVVAYIDITMLTAVLNTKYSNYYGKMIVSPFAVADKKLLFTRRGEEGIIYYYEDDGEEFTYLLDPYYQYHNGTDLKTGAGISILNWDYDYNPVYIQNGLVRLGVNRLTGDIYLAKYDSHTKQYITTHRFHLKKYNDVNINTITDDKIEIQLSNCIFTIWRGHPYIGVKHRSQDIFIDTKFDGVWAEAVGSDDPVEYPIYWDLRNSLNLIDEFKTSNITVEDSEETGVVTSLSISTNDTPDTINENYTFTISGSINNPTDSLGDTPQTHNGAFGYYTVTIK